MTRLLRCPARWERFWVNISGLGVLLLIGLFLLAACTACPDSLPGCQPFPIPNPYR
jgi:starvation-inducible outer membrane lipoprotein